MNNYWQTRLLGAIFALFTLAGCGSLPDERAIRQTLGMEQSFTHYDVPAPPTPAGFVLALGLNQADTVVYRELYMGVQGTIDDPRAIEYVTAALRNAPLAGERPTGAPPHAVTLDFHLNQPERTVIVTYNPERDTLIMYNIPTPAWPEHMVATYTVPPGFGAALSAALNTQPQP